MMAKLLTTVKTLISDYKHVGIRVNFLLILMPQNGCLRGKINVQCLIKLSETPLLYPFFTEVIYK
jgi:hypothetical protein